MSAPVAAFAYYLPQFYPSEFNARWWGEGFTEWVSLLRAHRGHRSPADALVTPGELGFYDLRDREVRARQGDLARAGGLSAFCLYHYWSGGSRPLPVVEDLVLSDGQPDLPFFLGWANHDWSLAWKGDPTVTLRQEYDERHDDRHIGFLLEGMRDPRYWTVDGRHVLLVYDPMSVPSMADVSARWRAVAKRAGVDLMLLGATRTGVVPPPGDLGLDRWVEGTAHVLAAGGRWSRAAHSLRSPGSAWRHLRHRDVSWSYPALAGRLRATLADYPPGTVPLVLSGWNNVGRRHRRASSTNADPATFREAVAAAAALAPVVGTGRDARRLLAVNAWNEWGEGMTLEPSTEFGRGMLDALCAGLSG
ncbi:MAG: glycoside hydrolase family 99-like domain-containing protein [Nocardioidaceae bacterium]|nr:glycoside hydrolase family 99-like domain-containing protein [Nocardioidaceae bacterium]MCL2613020.1 glycoside hydrolase family 99-like domain-containing protein [Nocardioidaceae bacterium]